MATVPNLIVAGSSGVARKLRDTGRFPGVFDVGSAAELRALSRGGQVSPPMAFMFAPGFVEDLPDAAVAVLANGLAASGYTVVVHDFFVQRGDVFDPRVTVAAGPLKLSGLLATFGIGGPEPGAGRRGAPQGTPAARSGGRGGVRGAASPPSAAPAPPAAAVTASPGQGRVIAVASAKGGVGKTSAAVNLSVYAARVLQAAGRPGTAVIVDTNFQQADVARYLNLRSPTILDILRTPSTSDPAAVRGQLAQVPGIELYALLGPPDAVSADPGLINSALYRQILPVLRRAFDFVFIDTPVAELYHVTFNDLILPEADAILVPVEPNRVTLESARSWLRAITLPRHARGGGVDPGKLSLVLNRARADVDCGPEEVMDLLPGWRFAGMIPEDQEWMQAVNTRQLTAMRLGPGLEATFREILRTVTEDPVFEAAQVAPQSRSLWRSLLGLDPK